MDDIALPKAVEDFVAATNAHDADALAAVFGDGADDALGRREDASSASYSFTSQA
jgi:hypothetical protein